MKNITNLSSAEYAQRVVKLKVRWRMKEGNNEMMKDDILAIL